jgi:hypothetical protein
MGSRLDRWNMECIVRSHQVVPAGYETMVDERTGKMLFGVFSAPDHEGGNCGTIVDVFENGEKEFKVVRSIQNDFRPRDKTNSGLENSVVIELPAGRV